MSAAADFPYPGDDPAELIAVSSAFADAQARFDSVAGSIGAAKSSMAANWESDAATAADADLGKLGTALSESSTHLGTAARAVDAYQSDLVKIRSNVDDLRTALNRRQTELSDERTQYARAGRFGEVNDMNPAQVASYRGGISSDEALTQRRIRHLYDEYDVQVRRADTATTACREVLSTSIQGRQYSGTCVVNVTLGTALGLNNLTMLAAWEAAVEKRGPCFPTGTTPAHTAQLAAAYWASLPPEVQSAFIAEHPKDVGNVDGVPVADRSTANLSVATADKATVTAAVGRLHLSAQELADLAKHPDHISGYARLLTVGQGVSFEQIQSYLNATKCLNAVATDHELTRAPVFLLGYDSTAYDGKGTAAVSIGDPDTADNTAFCVPGLAQRITSYIGNSDGLHLYEQMHQSDPMHTQAVVQWMGYDAPGFSNVASENAAVNGAVQLASAVAGLQASHTAQPGNLTVIAHSYGSTTAADACVLDGMRPSNLVLIGSPGAGHAHTVTDLGLPPGHVYVGSASQDPVTHVATRFSNPLGVDPATTTFGATRFHAEAVNRGGDHSLVITPDHSRYYDVQDPNATVPIPSQSLQNLSDVATGHGQRILVDGQLAPSRQVSVHAVGAGRAAWYPETYETDSEGGYTPQWGSPTQ